MNQITKLKLKLLLPITKGVIISIERWELGGFDGLGIDRMWVALQPYFNKRRELSNKRAKRRTRRGFNSNYVKLPF